MLFTLGFELGAGEGAEGDGRSGGGGRGVVGEPSRRREEFAVEEILQLRDLSQI